MGALYLGLIALGLFDCLGPLLAHLVAGGQIPLARDLAQVPLMAAFLAQRSGLPDPARATCHQTAAGHSGGHTDGWGFGPRPLRVLPRPRAPCMGLVGRHCGSPGAAVLSGGLGGAVGGVSGRQVPTPIRAVGCAAGDCRRTGRAAPYPDSLPQTAGRRHLSLGGRQPASPLHTFPHLAPGGSASTAGSDHWGGAPGLATASDASIGTRSPLATSDGFAVFITLPAANALVQFGVLGRNAFIGLFLVVFSLATGSLAIGLMRSCLFDVRTGDPALSCLRRRLGGDRRPLHWPGRGLRPGDCPALPGCGPAILVTIGATIAFQPARLWLGERMAGRLVFGKWLSDYELLRELSAGFDQTLGWSRWDHAWLGRSPTACRRVGSTFT